MRGWFRNGGIKWSAVTVALMAIGLLGGWYGGWKTKVEAAVLDHRMLVQDDAALQALLNDKFPKLNEAQMECHEVNRVQQVLLESHSEEIRRMAASVERTNDLVQMYLKSRMEAGEIRR